MDHQELSEIHVTMSGVGERQSDDVRVRQDTPSNSALLIMPEFFDQSKALPHLVRRLPCSRTTCSSADCPFAHWSRIPCPRFYLLEDCSLVSSNSCRWAHEGFSRFSFEFACMVAAQMGDEAYHDVTVRWIADLHREAFRENLFIVNLRRWCSDIPCGAEVRGLQCILHAVSSEFCPFAHSYQVFCKSWLTEKKVCHDANCEFLHFSHARDAPDKLALNLRSACLVARVPRTDVAQLFVDDWICCIRQADLPVYLFVDAYSCPKGFFSPKVLLQVASQVLIGTTRVYCPVRSPADRWSQAEADQVQEYLRFLKPYIRSQSLTIVPVLLSEAHPSWEEAVRSAVLRDVGSLQSRVFVMSKDLELQKIGIGTAPEQKQLLSMILKSA